jgi:hypothetical protein
VESFLAFETYERVRKRRIRGEADEGITFVSGAFDVTVTDSQGGVGTQSFTLTVDTAAATSLPPVIQTTSPLAAGLQGHPYVNRILASDRTAPSMPR